MFSFNGEGRPIAVTSRGDILNVEDPDVSHHNHNQARCCKLHVPEICRHEACCNKCPALYEDDDDSEGEKEVQLNPGEKFTPLPDTSGRFVELIAGPSGSGKSTIAGELASEFHEMYPKKKIYAFCRTNIKEDPAFHGLPLIQIATDESIIEDPIDITYELRQGGALLIFDDCATIHNDAVRKEVEKLMSDAMEVGRKLDCNIIITNHLIIPNERKFARTVMNEMNMLTVFPKSGSSQQIKHVLKTYWGMNNQQINDILAINSRWIRISKNYPQYVLWDEGAKIL